MLDDAPMLGRTRLDAESIQRTVLVAVAGLMLVWIAGAVPVRRRRGGRPGVDPAADLVEGPLSGPVFPVYGPPTPSGSRRVPPSAADD
jgi:hypothetical protein